MVRVQELVSTKHLNLRLLAGERGLERPLEWAHVSELEDPTPWLDGNELLMTTGMGVPPEPVKQVAYVERLVRRGVAALAINADMLAPPLATELLETADGSGFPVIEVPVTVPFEAIARVVIAESLPESRPAGFVQVFYALRTYLANCADVGELFQHLEAISGYQLFGVSTAGQLLHEDLPLPPSDLDIGMPMPIGASPFVLDSGGFVVPVPIGRRVAGHLVAIQGASGEESGLRTVQLVATIVAFELASLQRQKRSLLKESEETLRELLTGGLEEEAAKRRLGLAGFRPGDPLTMLAIDMKQDFVDSDLEHEWERRRFPFLILREDVLHALVPSDSPAIDALASCCDDVRVGGSRSRPWLRGLATARQEALWALRRATETGLQVVSFSDDPRFAAWLPPDVTILAEIVDRVLGPIVTYDEQKGTNLLESLRVWLHHDRSLETAARVLSIHKHTLSYRLRRVEALTGMRLSQLPDLVDCWLALQASDVVLPAATELRFSSNSREEPVPESRQE